MLLAGEIRDNGLGFKESLLPIKELGCIACAALCVWTLTVTSPVMAANQRLPPLSTEPDRCEKAFVGNTIGQANGVYDKPLDLRFCDYTNDQTNLKGAVFKNTVLSGSTFDGANLEDVIFEDTIIGYIDLQKICRNETINTEGRLVLGCR